MGGSKTTTIQPAPAPTVSSSHSDLVANYPRLVELQSQYAPQLAASDFQVNQQYAPQYAQLQQQIDQTLYPQTSKLQESLATQALNGMDSQLPDWAKQQYASDFNAGIGMNANAPIGVSDRNIGLLNLQKQWQDYYRNLGLSVANRQPLQQGQTLNSPTLSQGITTALGQTLGYNQGTYASQIAGTNYGRSASPLGMAGGIAGGIAGATLGGPQGAIAGFGIGSSLGGF